MFILFLSKRYYFSKISVWYSLDVNIMSGRVSVKNTNNYQIFKIFGDFDNLFVYQNKEKICLEINNLKAKDVLFYLSSCDFIDSSGIGLLLGRYNQLKNYGANLIICGINPNIKKIIQISGIAKIIDVYEEISEKVIQSGVILWIK